MGDQNAVDVAQALHVDLLSAAGAVTDSGLVRGGTLSLHQEYLKDSALMTL